MEYNNNLNRTLAKLQKLPSFVQKQMRDYAIGRFVKFVGTASIHFETMTCNEVAVTLPNKNKVQNHIGQIHAAATTLLAETATGMVVGMNIPDDKLPLMKNLSVKFIKRSQGQQKAVATLTNDQIKQIRETDKGEVNVSVKVTDETEEEVVITEMIWAWILKKK
jgi:acyl-coenzyme A thioesterase PaaI-like protein